MIQSVLLVMLGAGLGAVGRWLLSLWCNAIFTQFALGTLLANWLGCFFIGIAMGIVLNVPGLSPLSPPIKLFLVTGFLGGGTTFSTFSAEVMDKILDDKWLHAFSIMSLHLLGGLLLTGVGFFIARHFT